MAEFSLPRDGHASGVVTDAEYNLLARMYAESGLYGTPAETPLVFGDSSGMQIKVRQNRFGMVEGRLWGSGTTETTRSVGANASGQTRVDRAVLKLTRATPIVELVVKAGTPGAGPPALTQDTTTTGSTGVYEIPVAKITVVNGAATITAGNVDPDPWFLGGLMVVCESTDRPGHKPGRRIYETDTGRSYVSTGTTWVGFGGVAPVVAGLASNLQLDTSEKTILTAAFPARVGDVLRVHFNGQTDSNGDNRQTIIRLRESGNPTPLATRKVGSPTGNQEWPVCIEKHRSQAAAGTRTYTVTGQMNSFTGNVLADAELSVSLAA